jgi:hypothetical protein
MVPVRQVCKWCGKTYSVKERLKGQEISEGNFVDFNSLKKPERNDFFPKGQKTWKAIYGILNSPKNQTKNLL